MNKTNTHQDLEVMNDIDYIRKSSSLVSEALHRGCDVIQTADGDVFVTEVKTVTFHYTWDSKKGRMVRVNSGGRSKKIRKKNDVLDAVDYHDDLHGAKV
ncbi:MAG: DUF2671 domain-containing protein [Alphaproteobacteria bacterium]|nr:DUF2671 domain-containing protein [Alphaproteobacteria bacterium]OJV12168.1 MAG: hypothetical protein BGO27_05460 [Alphaproteobacteria bacterium 33-17]